MNQKGEFIDFMIFYHILNDDAFIDWDKNSAFRRLVTGISTGELFTTVELY